MGKEKFVWVERAIKNNSILNHLDVLISKMGIDA